MKAAAKADITPLPAVLARGLALLLLWVILMGPALKDLPVGLVASATGAWSSTLLWPARGAFSWAGLSRFSMRFLRQSVIAGCEVAKRAFAREPDLQPGFSTTRSTIPVGFALDSACAVMSLQPGKLPVAAGPDGTLLIHCLDLREAVDEQVAEDEAAFRRLLQAESADV